MSNTAAACLRYGALCALALSLSLASSLANANTPPTISGKPPATITAAHAYAWQPLASDSDGDTLTFSISNMPSWANFAPSTGRLRGTPTSSNLGTFGNIVICVSDGTYRSCLPAFSVKVYPPDHPPVITGTPPATATIGSPYSFQPTTSDPNGLHVAFEIWSKPSWAAFDSTTGRLYGTPGPQSAGTYSNIRITAYDPYYSAKLPFFTITVSAAAQAPPASVTVNWVPPTENTDGSTLTNLAGYHLYYGTNQASLGNVVDITNPGLASYVLSNLSAATWYFALASINTAGVESPRSAVVSAVVQ